MCFLSSYWNTGGQGLWGICTQSYAAVLPVYALEFPLDWRETGHSSYLYHTLMTSFAYSCFLLLFPFSWVLPFLISYCCVEPSFVWLCFHTILVIPVYLIVDIWLFPLWTVLRHYEHICMWFLKDFCWIFWDKNLTMFLRWPWTSVLKQSFCFIIRRPILPGCKVFLY